ncbi:MAG: cysteine-rich CWC family protein [Burkholderiaceae bacterium]|nr:cysteine-rich CWC family protein [Burkholderiaceae bacterium]
MIDPTLDASLCPLCGRSNQCAVTAGADPANCWCMHTPVSREALDRLAAEQRDRSCLCPACAAGPANQQPVLAG